MQVGSHSKLGAMIECIFGWGKQHCTLRKIRFSVSVALIPFFNDPARDA